MLGITEVEAGCKTLKIEPHLGNLDWAEGTFPTPLGIVMVKHERLSNGEVKTTVDAPDGIKIL